MADITLELAYGLLQSVDKKVDLIEARLKELNGSVQRNQMDIAVLKDWRITAAPGIQSITASVVDLKVQVAKMMALGGSFGVVTGIVVAILKAAGVM